MRCSVPWILTLPLLLPLAALAQDAGDLAAIAQQDGWGAVAKLAEQAIADLGPKSGARMMELSGLRRLRFPAELRGAAATGVEAVSAVGGITMVEDQISGVVYTRPALTQAPQAVCVTTKGKAAKAPLVVSAEAEGWRVAGLLGCWDADGAWVLLHAAGEDPKALLKGPAGVRGEGDLPALPEPATEPATTP